MTPTLPAPPFFDTPEPHGEQYAHGTSQFKFTEEVDMLQITRETEEYTVLSFTKEMYETSDIKSPLPKADPTKGVILEGRAPVWAYAHCVHEYHATVWVATHDPRLNGAVVVARHSKAAPDLGSIVSW